ncbi:MAG: TRAP transporter large permease subunit [Halobacteriovoraceae bacterium]|nr:TRAP transporter large permease subunit [Halobacteriovoraceae bacterium]
MNEILLVVLFFILSILGVPLFAIMGGLGIFLFKLAETDISAVSIEMYRVASSPTLLTIPLFTFAGYLLAESKSPQRLLNLADSFLGKLPGGVAIVSLIVCAFFTAFTGASGITIIALGGLLYPMLMEKHYTEEFTLGLITTSGSLGLLFPPSLPLILYGIVAKVDIDLLFKAGIIPGILLITVLSAYAVKKNSKSSPREEKNLSIKEALLQAKYELPLPFIILGGIYSGTFTVTEASTITATYVLIMECFLYKDLNIMKDLPRIINKSMTLVGAILLILSCALGLTSYLIDEEIPMLILEKLKMLITNKYAFLLFLNVFLLVVGSLMDIFSAIIVVLPLILPLAENYGIHPIHMAIIFLTNLEIGYITPPVGINLFISTFRFDRSILQLYKASFPFLLLLLFCLIIITYIPALSLFFIP